VVTDYIGRMHALSDELMSPGRGSPGPAGRLLRAIPGSPHLRGETSTGTRPADRAQPPRARAVPGSGPHTDFGTVTVLDREPGRGGLQIYTLDGTWIDAPYRSGRA